jgi:hypothetical protein
MEISPMGVMYLNPSLYVDLYVRGKLMLMISVHDISPLYYLR